MSVTRAVNLEHGGYPPGKSGNPGKVREFESDHGNVVRNVSGDKTSITYSNFS